MIKIKEVIVVEGRYDKNTVSQAVEATVIETAGFGIFSDVEKLALLKKLAEKRGLIILTDSDSAGFLIRGHLKGKLGKLPVKQAYIPDIAGSEKRKRTPSKEGKLGVEGMTRQVIIDALLRAGATISDDAVPADAAPPITKADLYEAGLSGAADSADRRQRLLRELGLPARLSPNALLDVLNAMYTRDEFMNKLLS